MIKYKDVEMLNRLKELHRLRIPLKQSYFIIKEECGMGVSEIRDKIHNEIEKNGRYKYVLYEYTKENVYKNLYRFDEKEVAMNFCMSLVAKRNTNVSVIKTLPSGRIMGTIYDNTGLSNMGGNIYENSNE